EGRRAGGRVGGGGGGEGADGGAGPRRGGGARPALVKRGGVGVAAGARGGAARKRGGGGRRPAVVLQWAETGIDRGGGGADLVPDGAVDQAARTVAVANQVEGGGREDRPGDVGPARVAGDQGVHQAHLRRGREGSADVGAAPP